jgi:hypothetical protein
MCTVSSSADLYKSRKHRDREAMLESRGKMMASLMDSTTSDSPNNNNNNSPIFKRATTAVRTNRSTQIGLQNLRARLTQRAAAAQTNPGDPGAHLDVTKRAIHRGLSFSMVGLGSRQPGGMPPAGSAAAAVAAANIGNNFGLNPQSLGQSLGLGLGLGMGMGFQPQGDGGNNTAGRDEIGNTEHINALAMRARQSIRYPQPAAGHTTPPPNVTNINFPRYNANAKVNTTTNADVSAAANATEEPPANNNKQQTANVNVNASSNVNNAANILKANTGNPYSSLNATVNPIPVVNVHNMPSPTSMTARKQQQLQHHHHGANSRDNSPTRNTQEPKQRDLNVKLTAHAFEKVVSIVNKLHDEFSAVEGERPSHNHDVSGRRPRMKDHERFVKQHLPAQHL